MKRDRVCWPAGSGRSKFIRLGKKIVGVNSKILISFFYWFCPYVCVSLSLSMCVWVEKKEVMASVWGRLSSCLMGLGCVNWTNPGEKRPFSFSNLVSFRSTFVQISIKGMLDCQLTCTVEPGPIEGRPHGHLWDHGSRWEWNLRSGTRKDPVTVVAGPATQLWEDRKSCSATWKIQFCFQMLFLSE